MGPAPDPARSPLDPRRWPVRWRLTAVSAGLTFAILVIFALVVGQLVTERLRADFRSDLELAAGRLAAEIDPAAVTDQDLERIALSGGAVVRIVRADGSVVNQPRGIPDLAPPSPGTVLSVGDYEVASFQLFGAAAFSDRLGPLITEPLYVQVARPRSELDETVGRLWLFLALGVIGATALATLAGLAVANRAMRPIAQLTATADRVATTRDPSLRIEDPGTDDEIAELARMLDKMLTGLDSARHEIEQMMQAQREFVADASHELRTPLTSIHANLELLADALEDERDPEGAAAAASALRSSKRMKRLVGDLLMLARADAGQRGPRGPCDLRRIVEGAVEEVRPVAGDRRFELDAPEPAAVEGNQDELHRLVLNLVENAVNHTPEDASISVSVEADDQTARLAVEDTGPGIPEGMEEEIFGRFVRGDGPADRRAGSSTGLGLAIVRAVAEAHGGTVRAGGSRRGGARFEVRLPV